ncbi:helix-turn-helix domain-containing protein [Reticulibacter mediterranei]|nr:AraC family transcriptional regulator [Reticulibacter mediterranei]
MTGSILHARSCHHYWQGEERLSIKTFFSGRVFYAAGGGIHAVDPQSYLVLNYGQPYTIAIDSASPVESFCLFFDPGLAEEVYHSMTSKPERLLALPEPPARSAIHFFERIYPHDDLLTPALLQLRTAVMLCPLEHDWLNEQFHSIMQRLLQVHFNVWREVEMLPAVRAATREEIYRRLYRAKDYADALFDTPLTLHELADVAALSPNHFLRTFKQAFRQTPYQYIVSKRVERAQVLLLHSDLSVTDICFSVGFESLGSFSWLFRRRVGLSPDRFRRQGRS